MTDLMYFAGLNPQGGLFTAATAKAAPPVVTNATPKHPLGGHPVGGNSMYYQEHPGAPLIALSDGKPYDSSVAATVQYQAWAAARLPSYAASAQDVQYRTTQANIARVIEACGLVN